MYMSMLLPGAVLGVTVAGVAWRMRALTGSGAAAAAILGTLAVTAGWSWAIVLVAYFVTSTALSRFRAREKEQRTGNRLEKGGRRDAAQVMANGGVFGVASLAFLGCPDPMWQAIGAGALAASAADTWATEIGTLARAEPRSVITGRPVPTGTSGAVSGPGLVAALAGAAFVALTAAFTGWPPVVIAGVFAGGVSGSMLDSVLGATLQCRRWCHHCGTDTERIVHGCGTRTSIVGGQRWLDNDGVNALSTFGGALVAALAARSL